MKDYARQESGSSIIMASCMDDRYPAENMLDGKDNTFWITTGMFPQEFVVAMAKPVQVSQIVVLTLNGEAPNRRWKDPCMHAHESMRPCAGTAGSRL